MKIDDLDDVDDVYVIWWRFVDGSDAGVCRVHLDQQRAEEERDLLEAEHPEKEYRISEQPVYAQLADDS